MSALREALQAVKSDIRTVEKPPAKPKKENKKHFQVPADRIEARKTFVNGYGVSWAADEMTGAKIPFIQTSTFYTQYPTKNEDIKLPEGTVKATYNPEKKRAEFFASGSEEPIYYVNNARHEPLPVPRVFSELEKVEEIFEIDFETGEVSCGVNVDILPEGIHWKLRLQEFETQQVRAGVKPHIIRNRLQKHVKNLESVRGVKLEELAAPIPDSVLNAIAFAEQKMLAAGIKR